MKKGRWFSSSSRSRTSPTAMEKATTTARKKVGSEPCLQIYCYLLTLDMIYDWAIFWPRAFIFMVRSCSSLSHSTLQFRWGRYSFTEPRLCFPIGSLIWAAVCLEVERGNSLLQIPSTQPAGINWHFVVTNKMCNE